MTAKKSPEKAEEVNADHPAVEKNPRADASAEQNRVDFNDPKRRKPNDEDYEGKGLDPTPYGKKPSKK